MNLLTQSPQTGKNKFTEFTQEYAISFASDQKRSGFYTCKTQMVSWIEQFSTSNGAEMTKTTWTLPFSIAIRIASLAALSMGGFLEENTTQQAAQLAFDKGSIDFTSMLAAVKKPKNDKSHGSPRNNQGRSWNRNYRGSDRVNYFRTKLGLFDQAAVSKPQLLLPALQCAAVQLRLRRGTSFQLLPKLQERSRRHTGLVAQLEC